MPRRRPVSGLVSTLGRVRDRLSGAVIATFLAGSLAVWGFLTLAGAMREGETSAIDERLMLTMREAGDPNDPLGPRWLEEAMRDVTALGGFTVLTLVTIVVVVTLMRARRWREALGMATVALGAELTSDVVKLVYARPRPDLVPHGSYVYSNSFPSGHSTLSVAIYFTLAALLAAGAVRRSSRKMMYAVAGLVVLLIGVSRVYLGVHWPTDVAAGWALGSIWALIGWRWLGAPTTGEASPTRR